MGSGPEGLGTPGSLPGGLSVFEFQGEEDRTLLVGEAVRREGWGSSFQTHKHLHAGRSPQPTGAVRGWPGPTAGTAPHPAPPHPAPAGPGQEAAPSTAGGWPLISLMWKVE